MSLWAEVKRGSTKPTGEPARMPEPGNQATGKDLIRQTLKKIADLWTEIEASGGSIAWEWILQGSTHGARIRQAEDRVNAIGSRGNPASLKAACDAWQFAWREGIEAWKRRNPVKETSGTKQALMIF